MIDPSLYAAFLVASVLLVLVPGPDMLMIVALGMRNGPIGGLMAAAGVAVGLGVHTVAAVCGLSAVFTHFPVVFQALKWAGALYLIYLAIGAFRDRGDWSEITPTEASKWQCFSRAVITNVLNPKVIIFNVAFLPQFVNSDLDTSVGAQLAILGVTLVVVDFMIDGPIGVAAGSMGRKLMASNKRVVRGLNITCGVVFSVLAGKLVFG
ncbi:LysE family translocator [Nocardia sp. CDC159]|uniref:LysE family translocator n=1 Tax=Nocardia pulmonis TaxID=2951408 RepID=A0A9X2EID1_9NOCA|nr:MULTISPECIES: LysE family translocator [Nocardia]MCM6778783.1 LysE family translocator [Nocardia pulmonis]MCM6791672.1 LysE family translocator [Nocardia sp. CDC159]